MDNYLFICYQYILVIFAGFMIGCGALFLFYWAIPNLRKLGYTSRLNLLEVQKEYVLSKDEYQRLKADIKAKRNEEER